MKRRAFLKVSAVGAPISLVAKSAHSEQTSTPSPRLATPSLGLVKMKPTIGIQIGSGALMSPDLDRMLGDLRSRAGVNALFPFIYGHVARWAGVPDAGFRGGNFAIPHMQYYKDTNLTYEDMRAPEAGAMDVLARTIETANKHGIKTFAWLLENNTRVPNAKWSTFYEVDFKGRRADAHPSGPCYNNPLYRAFTLALVEDYARSYAVAGFMWSSERQGGLLNALGAWHHGEDADPGQATCFCEHCERRGRAASIDVAAAKRGFSALETFVRAGRAHQRPRDGYFVSFFRILLQYPELLAWEKLWIHSRLDFMTAIRTKVKAINKALPLGWHIWHNVSFSPFHRAEMDYAEIAKISDYIKPVLYSNSAGERIKSFADSVSENVFADLPARDTLAMLYQMLDYQEAPYDRVTAAGLSPDYVRRETRRTVDDVAAAPGPVEVWPGIDIDVPVPRGASLCTPESVKQTVLAAFEGGATGVVLSRNYAEMKPENLAGAGAALQELGLK
jgi:hypothetical protein